MTGQAGAAVRMDFAIVQPIVYTIRSWMALRRAIPEIVRPGGALPAGVDGFMHLVGDGAPLFDERLDQVESVIQAFPILLDQARDFPCLVTTVDHPSTRILAEREGWPQGLRVMDAQTRLIVPRSGDLVLLHLASCALDLDERVEPRFGIQRDARAMYQHALELDREELGSALDDIVGRILGSAPSERAADALEGSVGHFVTLAHSGSEEIRSRLSRVHQVQEGTSDNQRDLILSEDPDEACYAHFGWAYSTVATERRALSWRLVFPLIAVNQAWYRYRALRADLIEMAQVTHGLDTDRDLIEQTEFYNEAVLDVTVWEAEREAFERGLRPVFRAVYRHLWAYWDTGESRETVHSGIDRLRDFLDRKYSVKLATRESTQARILFVIAIFQLLSVFGLASGYLYFWEKTPLDEAAIFDSPVVVWGTILSPILVVVVITWLLVGFFRRHR